MPPFRTSVVHIVDFRKEEFLDRHESHLPQAAGKRPFLCVLSPDTLQLVTAGDASDQPVPVSTSLLKLATGKPDRPAKAPSRHMSLLQKLAAGSHPLASARRGGQEGGEGAADSSDSPVTASPRDDFSSSAAAGTASSPPQSGRSSRAGEDELGDSLEEGQLLRFTIALSQVAHMEVSGRRLKIYFHRQKPHRSTESEDDWKAMTKAAVLPFALPVEALKHGTWSIDKYINRHRRDPFMSSVVLEADSPQEAAALHGSVEEAISRLAQAVQWLAQDLPLQGRPVVTLVTITSACAAAAAAAASISGPASPARGGDGGWAGGGGPAAEQIVCAFPQLQQAMDIPIPAAPEEAGLEASGGGAKGGGGNSSGPTASLAGEAELAAEGDELAVHVWLHSPLGPAVASITSQQLQRSAEAGGAPLVVTATPRQDEDAGDVAGQAAAGMGRAGRDRLEVALQFKAERHVAPPAARRLATHASLAQPAFSGGWAGSAAGGGVQQRGAAGSGSSGGGSVGGLGPVPAMLAVLCVPLLAALLQQRSLEGSGPAAAGVLTSVAFLISCLAALGAIVLLALRGGGQAVQQAPAPPPPVGWWRLVLLHAELVRESCREAGCPPLRRVVASTNALPTLLAAPPTGAGAPLTSEVGPVELPPPIRNLVERHPAVLSDDVAARFLVGLGGADKADAALRNMVEWVEAQGVADLVSQPQPRFSLIKQHYPQVFYAWSKTSDCILEVECTGRWRQAFDALREQGVTEQELMRHQFFCMEYAFKVLDPRPLPHGKAVKIIDLAGLSMRDVSSAAFKWYLQVGGALLATNYPQRLHKAFLVNAPAWSGVIWKVLAAVIPRRTREQLSLFTRKQQDAAAEAILQWVPAEQLPVAYGGKCAVPLGESELEREMAAYVAGLNSRSSSTGGKAAGAGGGDGDGIGTEG